MFRSALRAVVIRIRAITPRKNKQPSPRQVHAFTLQVTGMSPRSEAWLARQWTSSDALTFIRACYLTNEIPNIHTAAFMANRHFNSRPGMSFVAVESHPLETEDLLDDVVECFTPELLVTREGLKRLRDESVIMEDNHTFGELVA
jgi:hypothetical protein